MFNHSLIKRSVVVGLTAAAAAFPAAAQAMHPEAVAGGQPVAVTGPAPDASFGALRLTDASSDGYKAQSSVVPATSQPASATDASSGGYQFPSSVVAATTQPATTDSGSSFDWGDAGIGAGTMIVLLGAGGLSAATMRRRRTVVG